MVWPTGTETGTDLKGRILKRIARVARQHDADRAIRRRSAVVRHPDVDANLVVCDVGANERIGHVQSRDDPISADRKMPWATFDRRSRRRLWGTAPPFRWNL